MPLKGNNSSRTLTGIHLGWLSRAKIDKGSGMNILENTQKVPKGSLVYEQCKLFGNTILVTDMNLEETRQLLLYIISLFISCHWAYSFNKMALHSFPSLVSDARQRNPWELFNLGLAFSWWSQMVAWARPAGLGGENFLSGGISLGVDGSISQVWRVS